VQIGGEETVGGRRLTAGRSIPVWCHR
jgi:hypothetical protein